MKKIFTSGFYVMVATVLIVNTATTYKGDHGKYFEISKNIEIFTNLYKELNTYYVDELDPSKLMRTGIDAMLASLDPYTNYISESDIEGYRFITEGKYTGIGAKFKLIDNFPTITETYEETPAQKAGLKPGDIVLEIDGRSAKARTPEDVNDIMKGYPGTNVDLKVERPGEKEPIMLQLTREEVSVPNVPYSGLIGDDIGYAALTTFTREAGKNVADALSKLKAENPNLKGMVLDLRGNGGGLLTEAVNLCNVFIPKDQLVVSIKGKIKDWDRSFITLGNPVDEEIPLIVLINKNSASASEIVSGTLQDYDRAVLLGQRSMEKAWYKIPTMLDTMLN
ncbi:MAG: S41 family peptidase [Saprospiraceae bacterium]